MKISRRLVSNSFANVVGGVGGASVSLLLPPLLVRAFSAEEFSLWMLVAQTAANLSVFNLALPLPLSRFVSRSLAEAQLSRCEEFISSAFWVVMAILGLITAVLVAGAPGFVGLFPRISESLRGEAAVLVRLLGIAIALTLPTSVIGGIYTGMMRNWTSAWFALGWRVVLLVAVGASAWMSHSVTTAATAYLLCYLVAFASLVILSRRLLGDSASFDITRFRLDALKQLMSYAWPVWIWSLAMLMLSGLDLVLVGLVDFSAAGSYALAVIIVSFFQQTASALLANLVAEGASITGVRSGERLAALVKQVMRVLVPASLGGAAVVMIFAEDALRLWVGNEHAHRAVPFLGCLIVAFVIRYSLAPYTMMLISTGDHRKVLWTPILEGLIKLAAAVALAGALGPLGIAIASIVAGSCGALMNWLINMPRTTTIPLNRLELFLEAIARPLLLVSPLMVAAVLVLATAPHFAVRLLLAAGGAVASGYLCWNWFLTEKERATLRQFRWRARENAP